MMPRRRPARRTNSMLVANRSKNVMLLTVRWKPQNVTLDDIRKQVLDTAQEGLRR